MRLASVNRGQNLGFTKSVRVVESGDIVTLAQAKDFCRITVDDDDTYISLLIGMAEELVANYAGITLRTTEYTFEWEQFADRIALPYAPHTSVDAVRTKVDNVETTVDSDSYNVVGQANKTINIISPIYGGLEVDVTSGYGVANVPKTVQLAILKTVLTNYENRQDDAYDVTYSLPSDARTLLKPYKRVII